jgi:DNA-binding IclR family transcriptional regulator
MSSPHEIRVFRVLQANAGQWMTRAEISAAADINPRTTRNHLRRFEASGIVRRAKMFPADLYQLYDTLSKESRGYLEKLDADGSVLGI